MAVAAAAGGTALLASWAAAAPAAAQAAACSATVNGTDVGRYNSPDHALKVDVNDRVGLSGFTNAAATEVDHDVKLEFAGVRWTASSGHSSGSTWTGDVDVKSYADKGVGIYKVVTIARPDKGPECFNRSYVKVTGKSALSTVAGEAGAAATALGIVGAAVAAGRAGRDITPDAVGDAAGNFLEQQAAAGGSTEAADRAQAQSDLDDDVLVDRIVHDDPSLMFCGSIAVLAAALTLKAVAGDAVHTVVAVLGRTFR